MVEITEGADQGKYLKTKNILIATGCKARRLPDIPVDGVRVMTSREALVPQKSPPKSLIIVGAGAIGVEFAYFYNAFGTKVTLVEMLPQVLPVEDEEVARLLHRSFEKQGIAIRVGTKVENIRVGADSVKLALVKDGVTEETEAEALLLAVGVVANLDGVLSSRVKLDLDRGYVKVNDRYESSAKGVFAAGDIIGPPWLAHVATFRAINAVNGWSSISPDAPIATPRSPAPA
jgi:dihydrolipoamide dehydrogenase